MLLSMLLGLLCSLTQTQTITVYVCDSSLEQIAVTDRIPQICFHLHSIRAHVPSHMQVSAQKRDARYLCCADLPTTVYINIHSHKVLPGALHM